MVRRLKTFVTSAGFYDLAIAAPSMKAALEAWGAGSNLFHQGFAKETDDPDVASATLSKPGVVLKRPAGSDGAFTEHSELPKDLGQGASRKRVSDSSTRKAKKASSGPNRVAGQKAAQAYVREQRRREREEAKAEAARQERERKRQAIDKAQAARGAAEREHTERLAGLKAEFKIIEDLIQSEEDAWREEQRRLKAALRGIGD